MLRLRGLPFPVKGALPVSEFSLHKAYSWSLSTITTSAVGKQVHSSSLLDDFEDTEAQSLETDVRLAKERTLFNSASFSGVCTKCALGPYPGPSYVANLEPNSTKFANLLVGKHLVFQIGSQAWLWPARGSGDTPVQ